MAFQLTLSKRKLPLLLVWVLLGQSICAQTFTKVRLSTPFEGVTYSSIAFSDVDGDGDQDVLITGVTWGGGNTVKLSINDGTGSFTEATALPFEAVGEGSLAFSDVDSDGDEDLLITGAGDSAITAKLYINDGVGNFFEVLGTPFEEVWLSALAFSDVDGDGDQDVLITGSSFNGHITKLYANDGIGNFSEVLGTSFEGVAEGSLAFSDVDGDGDEDVLITGSNSDTRIAKLYTNDGMGNFSEVLGTPFEGVGPSALAFSDVDGDGDEDVFIMGWDSNATISKLYTNDGMGNFSEVLGTPFTPVTGLGKSALGFSDVDGDGDEDFLLSQPGNSRLYINDGAGNFSEATGLTFAGGAQSIAFSDVDGDGDQDVFLTGGYFAILYTNDGTGGFQSPFEGVSSGSLNFSDVDGDGDQDVLITGLGSSNDQIAKLYTNDGMGTFSEVLGTPFTGVGGSAFAFSDIDDDGDEDVLITGWDSAYSPTAKLYTNDGTGSFTEATGTPFVGVLSGSVGFSDVDGDGDEDVLISGMNSSNVPIAKLYTNNGTGNFSEVSGTAFEAVYSGSLAFSDVDGDGDEDVFLTGQDTSFDPIAKLYTNDGTGSFTETTALPFEAVANGSFAFSDVDGDGDQDVLITGRDTSSAPIAKLYTNDGTGSFTEDLGTAFEEVSFSALAFLDVDGDGDQDVLITGQDSAIARTAKLYTNDGTGSFTEATNTLFEGVLFGSLGFADLDDDGDEDLLITGTTIFFPFSPPPKTIANLYINEGLQTSIAEPSTPDHFDLFVFPNPADGNQLYIRPLSETRKHAFVKVFDLSGRLLIQQRKELGGGEETLTIDISTLSKGNYIIRIDDGLRLGVGKFVVQ